VDDPDDERQQDGCDQDARGEGAHLAPNLRPRRAYSSTAAPSRSSPKSGQSVSSKTSSAYADCHRRKFEIRCSPDVRITRSGSGTRGAYRREAIAASATSSAATPCSISSRAAPTISARPP